MKAKRPTQNRKKLTKFHELNVLSGRLSLSSRSKKFCKKKLFFPTVKFCQLNFFVIRVWIQIQEKPSSGFATLAGEPFRSNSFKICCVLEVLLVADTYVRETKIEEF
jgi:hypothetical protein